MKTLTFDQTRANVRGNVYKQWSNTLGTGATAKDRFEADFFYVHSAPKTRFSRDAKVFTIGSCFARNIEAELVGQGIEILTKGLNLPADF
jgi:hypothetical protein